MKKLFSILNPIKKRIVSIDAGTRYTGVTLWENQSRIVTKLLENMTKSRSLIPLESAKLILNEISKAYPIDLVVLEDFAYNSGGFFNTDQAEIAGIIKYYCLTKKINYTSIPPNTVKYAITSDGKAKKNDVMKKLKSTDLYEGLKTSHEFDSVAIGLTYFNIWDRATQAMYKRSILFKKED